MRILRYIRIHKHISHIPALNSSSVQGWTRGTFSIFSNQKIAWFINNFTKHVARWDETSLFKNISFKFYLGIMHAEKRKVFSLLYIFWKQTLEVNISSPWYSSEIVQYLKRSYESLLSYEIDHSFLEYSSHEY